jgi:hypothetical protein
LIRFLGGDTSTEVVRRRVEAASFEDSTKGRTRGEEDSTSFFRKGIAGDWRNVFTKQHKAIFKEYAGELLVELGYERDNDWWLGLEGANAWHKRRRRWTCLRVALRLPLCGLLRSGAVILGLCTALAGTLLAGMVASATFGAAWEFTSAKEPKDMCSGAPGSLLACWGDFGAADPAGGSEHPVRDDR